VTVTPGNLCDAGFESGSVKKSAVKLVMHKDGIVTRVSINQQSLLDDHAYLLDLGGQTIVYSGAKCRRVDRAVIEDMARRRAKEDYGKRYGDPVIVDVNGSEEHALFLKRIEQHKEPFWNDWERSLAVPPAVWRGPQDDDEATEDHDVMLNLPGLIRIDLPDTSDFDPILLQQHLLPYEMLSRDHVMVLDCVSEVFVWRGRNSTKEQFDRVMAILVPFVGPKSTQMDPMRPVWTSVQVVRDRFESIYFKQVFYDWPIAQKATANERAYMQYVDKYKAQVSRERSVSVEVKRIVEPLMRTEDGTLGQSHPFELKNLLLESPNVPSLTRIWECGKHGLLTERTGSGRAIFRSDSTYVILFSYKNGSAHVIHTWTGLHAPLTNRTACSLKAQTLLFDLKLDGAEYHSHLRQHAETIFFCELLRHADAPLVVLSRQDSSQPEVGY
jgi:hypothetical protein